MIFAFTAACHADTRKQYSVEGKVASVRVFRKDSAVVSLTRLRWTHSPKALSPLSVKAVLYGDAQALRSDLRPGTKVRATLVESAAGKWHALAYTVMAKNANNSTSPPPPADKNTDTLVFGLCVEPNPATPHSRVSFAMTLRNTGAEAVTCHRSSSQRFEIVAEREGRAVWKWSSGRFFTAAIETFTVRPGENVTYRAEWDLTDEEGRAVKPGTYQIRAWLKTMGKELPQAEDVSLAVR
ncbi:MAG: hypothetical protein IT209_05860 [Armatimonadetes bacterium]|nr:hypothetical protein [Armatimonadota bacterium]